MADARVDDRLRGVMVRWLRDLGEALQACNDGSLRPVERLSEIRERLGDLSCDVEDELEKF